MMRLMYSAFKWVRLLVVLTLLSGSGYGEVSLGLGKAAAKRANTLQESHAVDPNVPATSLSFTGPSSGAVGFDSAAFTVRAQGPLSVTVGVTPSDRSNGGVFTPATLSLTTNSRSASFTYRPSLPGAGTISISNTGGFADPPPLGFTAWNSTQTTPLGIMADSLAPGQWAILNTNNNPSWAETDGDIFAFANTGSWFEESGVALFVGSRHSGHNHHLLTYVDSTNSWQCGPLLDGNTYPYTFGTHAYDNNALDPTRGALWYNPKGNDMSTACPDFTCASGQYRRRFIRYDLRTNTWDDGILMPGNLPVISNTTALKYFPEMDGLVFVSAIPYQQLGRIFFYSFQTQTWRILGDNMPLGGESMFCQYSSRHKVMLFGGGYKYPTTPQRWMYKIDSAGTISALGNIPAGITKGIACEGVGYNTKFVEDPATGDFLSIGDDGTFWCYNLPSDQWQVLPNGPVLGSGGAFSIPRYGVIMVVEAHFSIPGTFRVRVYKHGHP